LKVQRVVASGEDPGEFDVHCPLPSLPGVFKTTLATIPAESPYLWTDQRSTEEWGRRMSAHASGLRVGLCWAGGPIPPGRSVKLNQLDLLAGVGRVTWFSLQKGAAASELKLPGRMKMIDWTEDLRDFADTGSLIANLDLVITVDTAVAHLAGAIGTPVWTLLRHAADWRWMLNRDESPWYPTMRLFRDDLHGDWGPVAERVAESLHDLVANRG
jgi:hypothetical protein